LGRLRELHPNSTVNHSPVGRHSLRWTSSLLPEHLCITEDQVNGKVVVRDEERDVTLQGDRGDAVKGLKIARHFDVVE
jgi:hypothetical protein